MGIANVELAVEDTIQIDAVTQESIEQDERHHSEAFCGRVVRESKLVGAWPVIDLEAIARRLDGSIAAAV